jgi:exopolyphosphatase / guanosine-5'-triphosphate,3'-diphosphate pyrophosphatase
MLRAVIDIGTNTVKLLVAEVNNSNVVHRHFQDAATRLGEGVDKTGQLSSTAISRTVTAIRQLADEARQHGAQHLIALTTSAVRDAGNGNEFLHAVREQTGLEVQLITGEREAELIYRGVTSDPVWANKPVLVMDVGGGSAEFIQGTSNQIERHQSLPVGAVRVMEQFGQDDFAGMVAFLREKLFAALAGYSVEGRQMIGTGGGIVTVSRIMNHATLTLEEIRALVAQLNAMTVEERQTVPGLPADRADIIVAGGAVFMVAMEILGACELTVSRRSIRDGVLVDAAW